MRGNWSYKFEYLNESTLNVMLDSHNCNSVQAIDLIGVLR